MPNMADIDLIGPGDVHSVFKPANIVNGVATFVKSTGVPLADRKITLSATRTPTGRVKVQARMVLPIVQDMTVGGITKPTVVRTSYFECSWTADAASTEDERWELMVLADALVGDDDTTIAMFKELEYIT
jgi:hypothetical protein